MMELPGPLWEPSMETLMLDGTAGTPLELKATDITDFLAILLMESVVSLSSNSTVT